MEKDIEQIMDVTIAASECLGEKSSDLQGLALAQIATARAIIALCDRLDKMTGTINEGGTKKALTVYDWSRNP
jgi:hypothetical protein